MHGSLHVPHYTNRSSELRSSNTISVMYIHDHSYMHARVSVSVLVYEGLDEVWACAGFGADVFGRLQQAACLAGRSLGEKPEPRAFHITPSKNPPPPPNTKAPGAAESPLTLLVFACWRPWRSSSRRPFPAFVMRKDCLVFDSPGAFSSMGWGGAGAGQAASRGP